MGDQEKQEKDEALILGVDSERHEAHILRRRGENVELGTVRALEDGKPIHGDVVRLKPNPEFPPLCEVETLVKNPEATRRGGPPLVASEAYRRGWDQIFGKNTPPEEEVN